MTLSELRSIERPLLKAARKSPHAAVALLRLQTLMLRQEKRETRIPALLRPQAG